MIDDVTGFESSDLDGVQWTPAKDAKSPQADRENLGDGRIMCGILMASTTGVRLAFREQRGRCTFVQLPPTQARSKPRLRGGLEPHQRQAVPLPITAPAAR